MTTVVMLIQRCIVILAIFLWHAEAHPRRSTTVDCEKYPYHYLCRGMMTKRRFVSSDCDSTIDPNCPISRTFYEKMGPAPQSASGKSRVWLKLLEDALQRDNAYEPYRMKYGAPQEKKKLGDAQQQYEDRRISKDFWQEEESADNDY